MLISNPFLISFCNSCLDGIEIKYFEVGPPQVPQEELEFQTMHNSFFLFNDALSLLISGGANPFALNGAGALQPFEPPFWHVYDALPYCGDYCIDVVEGCMDADALNYNANANTDRATTDRAFAAGRYLSSALCTRACSVLRLASGTLLSHTLTLEPG